MRLLALGVSRLRLAAARVDHGVRCPSRPRQFLALKDHRMFVWLGGRATETARRLLCARWKPCAMP
eukprot:1178142-Pyramimonas_sp.AAC.1